jgi:hypothetical protein
MAVKSKSRLKYQTPPIDDDLGWIDVDGKVNIQAFLAEGGITDPGEVEQVSRELTYSAALVVLKAVIAKRYQIANNKEATITDVTWPYQVAYREGYKKALLEIYRSIPAKTLI